MEAEPTTTTFLKNKPGPLVDVCQQDWVTDVYLRLAQKNKLKANDPEQVNQRFDEVWRAFFESNDVSCVNLVIREEISRGPSPFSSITAPIDLVKWIDLFCFGNYEQMKLNYFAKFHHCRWYHDDEATDPKLNILNVGDVGSMLETIRKTCPSGVLGSPLTGRDSGLYYVPPMNDILTIQEKVPSVYLGIVKDQSKTDDAAESLKFYKSRLTCGKISTLYFGIDDETKETKVTQVISGVQGSYLLSTTEEDVANADRHLLSRFILLPSVDIGEKKGEEGASFEIHQELHRYYYIVECMARSKVIPIELETARQVIDQTSEIMHRDTGTPILNSRQKNNILELARTMCILNAIWCTMTSEQFKYLQLDPVTGDYVGFNPRIFLEGVFPLLVISTDMIIQSMTLLSSTW